LAEQPMWEKLIKAPDGVKKKMIFCFNLTAGIFLYYEKPNDFWSAF
jgi:hypothetical protein